MCVRLLRMMLMKSFRNDNLEVPPPAVVGEKEV